MAGVEGAVKTQPSGVWAKHAWQLGRKASDEEELSEYSSRSGIADNPAPDPNRQSSEPPGENKVSAGPEQTKEAELSGTRDQPAIEAPHSQPDVCFGWLVVVAAFVIHIMAIGLLYSFGVFIKTLQKDFNESRGTVSWIPSLVSCIMLLACAFTGWIADLWSYQLTVAMGAAIYAAALLASSFAKEIWQLFLAYGILLGFGISCCFIPAVAAVGHWFQRKRALATGLAVSGSGVGTAVWPIAGNALLDSIGWRNVYRIFASVGFVSMLLCAIVIKPLIRRVHTKRRWVLPTVIRLRAFIFFGLAVFFYQLGFLIPFTHIVAGAQDRGIKHAAWLLSAMGASSTVGRIVLGFVADRIGKVHILKGSMLIMVCLAPAWPYLPNFWSLLLFALAFGFAAGTFIALVGPVIGDYFGTESIASIVGLIYACSAFGNLLGPSLAGIMYDHYKNYKAASLFCASSVLMGFILLWGMPDQHKSLDAYRAADNERKARKAQKAMSTSAASAESSARRNSVNLVSNKV